MIDHQKPKGSTGLSIKRLLVYHSPPIYHLIKNTGTLIYQLFINLQQSLYFIL